MSAECRVPSAWCRVLGALCRVPSAWCRVPGAWCRVPAVTRNVYILAAILLVMFLAPGTRHQELLAQQPSVLTSDGQIYNYGTIKILGDAAISTSALYCFGFEVIFF